MQKVLVLGGKGMLGHIVVKTLLGLKDINVVFTEKGDENSPYFWKFS